MKQLLDKSMSRSINSFSFFFLLMLFIVIVYSAYTINEIGRHLHEVVEVDLPLSEVIADAEMLQLKQHLLMEVIRSEGVEFFENDALRKESLDGLNEYNEHFSLLLEKAKGTVQKGLTMRRSEISEADHKELLALIQNLHHDRNHFNELANHFFEQGHKTFISHWQELERKDQELDEQAYQLLKDVNRLTSKVSSEVISQGREFLIVNMVLVVAALFIGLYLAYDILRMFRQKMARVRNHVDLLKRSIEDGGSRSNPKEKRFGESFTDLEEGLKSLVVKHSKKMRDQYELEKELIELATKDKLTGVFNRHKWDEQARQSMNFVKLGHPFSIALIDVDHFKQINDTLGHDIGDLVLQQLATQIEQSISETDMLFRLGGEEFVVLFKDTRVHDAEHAAERLRLLLQDMRHEELPNITVSIGVTEYQDGDELSAIVKRADTLLYQAKNAGRNQLAVG
ncbi:GGDEF domain-containing protein [Marinomonas dokdonensis]|uniref:GGDEF domain-containing protein n=1 Tax=Marinomonas dokdonensis TaxID=328224 RepID=UPI0040556B0D